MKHIVALLAMANVIGCSSIKPQSKMPIEETENRRHIVGTWYGKKQQNDGILEQTKLENFDDGTYRLRVKSTFSNGFSSNSMELGQWGLSGDIFFTISRGWVEGCSIVSTDTKSDAPYDAYKIDFLTASKVSYHHVSSSEEFSLLKVENDFTLEGGEEAMLDDCSFISKRSKKSRAPV